MTVATRLNLAHDADELAEYFDPVGRHFANRVFRVGRQQPRPFTFEFEPFQRDFVLDTQGENIALSPCLLYTSDAADDDYTV